MMSSQGRSGLMKIWARLRDQISSRKLMATPIWLRMQTSQSSTPPSSAVAATRMPVACSPDTARLVMKRAVKPQMHICRIGQ
jgi:hypothetical protein